MEEKERYRFFETAIQDTEYQNTDVPQSLMDKTLCCIRLNEQDARIKELEEENQQLKQQVEELKGKRLEFYNDDVRQTQVINGVHFDIEQLLVFSEYVEHEKNISADKDKQIIQLKQQLHDLPKKIVEEIRDDMSKRIMEKQIKWGDNIQIGFICNAINECLDTILKKFGAEDE